MATKNYEIKNYSKNHKATYAHVLKKIKEFDKIVVFRHIKPDYDALGTQMGLVTWIKDNFPQKEVHFVGDSHPSFTGRIFPESERLNADFFQNKFLAIIVDVGDSSRISDPRFANAAYKIKLDHHPFTENCADFDIIDTELSAASELVADMCYSFKGKYVMSKEAAHYFYIGLAGDSGRFQYSSTSAHTFAVAEELIKTGIDISYIYRNMYEKQIQDLKVTAHILNNFSVSPKGVAYYILTAEDLKNLNITTMQGKDNVNLFANIKDINAWCSITEDTTEPCWRVSIRSKEKAINQVAAMFEGGGHAQASGAKLNTLDDLPRMIEELDKLF